MYPHERSLVEKMKGRPFALVGINSDPKIETARNAVEKNQLTWPSFWCGPEGTRGPIPTKWAVGGWPTLYVIDHEGVIRHKSLGSPGDDVIDRWIEELVTAAEKAGGIK